MKVYCLVVMGESGIVIAKVFSSEEIAKKYCKIQKITYKTSIIKREIIDKLEEIHS